MTAQTSRLRTQANTVLQPFGIGILVATVLRLLLLGSKSFWLDEANSLRVATMGQTLLWSGGSERYHPPLFYWFVEQWMQWGQSEFFLRLPFALMGAVTIFLLYKLAHNLFDREVAISVLWLSALSPLLIWYSQELRSYALLMMLGVASIWSAVRLLKTGNLVWALLLIVSMVAALYAHYNAFLLLPLHGLLLAALWGSQQVRSSGVITWALSWIICGVLYWPWLTSPAAAYFLQGLLLSDSSYVAQLLAARVGWTYSQLIWFVLAGLGIGLPLAFFAVYWLFRHRRPWLQSLRRYNWVRIGVMALMLLVLLVEVYPRAYSLKRQLSLIWPYGLLLVAWILPWRPRALRPLSVLLGASALAAIITIVVIPKDEWRQTVAYVHEQAAPGDLVLLLPSYMHIPFDWYDQEHMTTLGFAPSQVDDLPQLTTAHPRIWLIEHTRDVADPSRVVASWLDEQGELVRDQSFHNIHVQLYQP